MNLFDLKNKSALITGGKGLLAPIWKETLENAGAEVFMYDLPDYDVRDRNKLTTLSENMQLANKIPDILIQNAAIDNPPTSKATFFGNCKEILDVNLQGAVNVCEAFIPKMIKNGGGVIVNIGSIQGYGGADWTNYPDPEFEKPLGYNLSKWGLRGLAKSITTQYGRYGIRCVTPSFSAFDGGKLEPQFLKNFLRRVPLNRCISKESMQMTLLYAVCCSELTGVDWRVDAGLGSWA